MDKKRQERLLEILKKQQGWVTGKRLAAILQVTDRTIRSDIRKLNEQSEMPLIESDVHKGYRMIKGRRPESLMEVQTIPQTAEARCIYIIQRLLFEVKEINLTTLSGQIYISDYSIEHDLKRIREMLKPYTNLRLVRNGKCISLQGDELSKRKFYKDLLVAEIQKDFLNLNQLAGMYREFNLLEVKNIFQKILEKYGYEIHGSLLPMVILHAGTNIERMLHANYISAEYQDESIKGTVEYQIAEEFYQRIYERLHVRVPESEIGRFAIVIMGKRASDFTNDYVKFRDTWLNTAQLASEAAGQIYRVFGIDFRDDHDLNAGLKMHLHGLIERRMNKVVLEDLFREEIQKKYPLIFEMGVFTMNFLEEKLETKIPESECAFLALHLGAASERLKAAKRYRAVAVFPFNRSFSKESAQKVTEMFKGRMELVAVLHYFEENAVRALEPDLILTSSPIVHTLDVPTVTVGLFTDFETEEKVLKALDKLDKKASHLCFVSNISSIMRKEHYYKNLECTSPEEIIRFLCKGLEEDGIVDSSFCDVVLKREEMAPTSFAGIFAIPHAFGVFANTSTIAVAHLKNPVRWGEFQVKLVMLFAVRETEQKLIKIFFEWISNLMNDMEHLAGLCEPCSYEQFMDRIVGE